MFTIQFTSPKDMNFFDRAGGKEDFCGIFLRKHLAVSDFL